MSYRPRARTAGACPTSGPILRTTSQRRPNCSSVSFAMELTLRISDSNSAPSFVAFTKPAAIPAETALVTPNAMVAFFSYCRRSESAFSNPWR